MEAKSLSKIPVLAIFRSFSVKTTEPLIAGLGKKAKKLLAEGIERKTKVPLEKDAKILVSHVCGTNLLAEGGENVKIKSDSEYPEWLWKISLGKPLMLQAMDPNTKQYWNQVNYLGRKKDKFLRSLQKHKTVHK